MCIGSKETSVNKFECERIVKLSYRRLVVVGYYGECVDTCPVEKVKCGEGNIRKSESRTGNGFVEWVG